MTARFLVPIFCLLAFIPGRGTVFAQGKEQANTESPLSELDKTVVREIDANRIQLVVQGENGKISMPQIWKAISRQVGFEVKSPFRRRRVRELQLDSPAAQWTVVGLNLALAPAIRLRVDDQNSALIIDVDKKKLTNSKQKFGAGVRELTNPWNAEGMGLAIADETKLRDIPDQRLVILIHGFNSAASRLQRVSESIGQSGLQTATFQYPTPLGVDEIAKHLSKKLHALTDKYPNLNISLVTHSMGGIIARAVVEDTDLDVAQIDQLIMVAPPNHGSELARAGLTGAPLEGALLTIDRPQLSQTVMAIVEEFNVAATDLRPDSRVLKRLNRQPRNERIRYSILLGNQSLLNAAEAKLLSASLKKANPKVPVVKMTTQPLADAIDQLTGELVNEQGDGAVSLKSGRLEGVEDVVELPFRHNDLLADASDVQKSIIDEIVKRLTSEEDEEKR